MDLHCSAADSAAVSIAGHVHLSNGAGEDGQAVKHGGRTVTDHGPWVQQTKGCLDELAMPHRQPGVLVLRPGQLMGCFVPRVGATAQAYEIAVALEPGDLGRRETLSGELTGQDDVAHGREPNTY